MAQFDAKSAECLVFTYKEGLLSAVAHDLKIRVTDFKVDIDETKRSVQARFDPASLRVVCAMKNGAEAPTTLSEKDLRDIEKNMEKDVLHPAKFPEIKFESASVHEGDGQQAVEGTLTLHGTSKSIRVPIRRDGDKWVAEVRINQPDFGVKPFKALLGALKVQPEIMIRLSVPAK